jgi:uncharacterized Zn finger protein
VKKRLNKSLSKAKLKATGTHSQSKEDFGRTWWGEQWVGSLERFAQPIKWQEGKHLAWARQVLDIGIEKGLVTARVGDFAGQSYPVKLRLAQFTPEQWAALSLAAADDPSFGEALFNGTMPPHAEKAFAKAGLRLMPEKFKDLDMKCPCTDWFKPCVHQLAVYLLLAEEFDRDPSLLFRLRGKTREEMQSLFPVAEQVETPESRHVESAGEPISNDPVRFWNGGELPDLNLEWKTPEQPAAPLRRLGHFPFWRGSTMFLPYMEIAYREISRFALMSSGKKNP